MYEWLRDYLKLEENIACLERNLEKTEWELKRWVEGDLQGVHLNERSKGARVEEEIELIKKDILLRKKQQKKLVQLVETFRGLDNEILRLKYISGMTLEDIAFETQYSISHISKRHAKLMKVIDLQKKGVVKS